MARRTKPTPPTPDAPTPDGARARMIASAPGRAQMAMTSPKRTATISSSALRQISKDTPEQRKARRNRAQTERIWQREAFDYAKKVGELGALLTMQANTVSLCGFPVRRFDDDAADWVANDPDADDAEIEPLAEPAKPTLADDPAKPKPVKPKAKKRKPDYDDRPANVMRNFVGPDGGQVDLVRRAAYNLFCAGDCTLLGTPHPKDQGILWEFLSVLELYPSPDGHLVRRRGGVGSPEEKLPEDNYTARLYRSDIAWSDLSTSEVERVLPLLQEITVLTQMVDAIARSRVPANLLFIPEGMSFAGSKAAPADPDTDEVDDTDDTDDLVDDLFDHMTAPFNDPGSAARLVPLVIVGPLGANGKSGIEIIELARSFDQFAQDLRSEALGRLAQGLDAPPEAMIGKANSSHWCVDDQTRILTRDYGWLTHDLLQPGDMVMTLDHGTGLGEWQPVGEIYRADVVDEPMMSIETRLHSSLTTMNHRWPTLLRRNSRNKDPQTGKRSVTTHRRWRTSETLTSNEQFVRAAPVIGLPTEAKWADAFVELVAWFVTEGTIKRSKTKLAWVPHATIGQSHVKNPGHVARIRRCLTELFGPEFHRNMNWSAKDGEPRWRELFDDDMSLFSLNRWAAERLLAVAPEKVLDRQWIHQLTQAQLALFVDTMIDGDGSRGSNGRASIPQTDYARIEAVEMAAILLGRGTSSQIGPGRGFSTSDQHVLSLHIAKPVAGSHGHRSPTTYSGTIWCPTTPNRTWLAQRNGTLYFTGNTAANVDSEFIVKHIQPIGILIADFLTWGYLRPMLEAYEDMTPEEAMKFKVEFDPSPVIARADEAKSARDLSDWLSDDAILMANGFTKADMASAEVVRVRRLWQLISTQPGQFAKLLPLLPGFESVDPEMIGTPAPPAPPEAPVVPPVAPDGKPGKGVAPDGKPAPSDGKTKSTGDETPNPDLKPGQRSEPQALTASGESAEMAIRVMLATAADAAISRALERAGSKVVSLAQSKAPELKARLRSTRKDRMMSLVTRTDLSSLGQDPKRLLAGAWDDLAIQAREWVRDHLIESGLDEMAADDRAALASHHLCDRLQSLTEDRMLSSWRPGSNRLRVPNSLINEVLEQAAYAGAL